MDPVTTGDATGTPNTDSGASKDGLTSLTGEPSVSAETQTQNKGKDGDATTKPGEQKDGDKGPEGDAKPPVVPEKYELKLPEGVLVDNKMMEKFTNLGKELKWDNATAQKMADMHLEALGAFAQKADADHEAQLIAWSKEVSEDKEIGGAKLEASITQARKVLTLASTVPGVDAKRLLTDMNRTGLATHPDMVRLFHYFGQFIGEDNQFIKGSPTTGGPRDAASILYGPDGVRK